MSRLDQTRPDQTNSGDLNPIETVWARLRRDLAVREMADLKAGGAKAVAM